MNKPNLNDNQTQAVLHTEGPLLVLAGAGSGKTTVLIHRIAQILLPQSPHNAPAVIPPESVGRGLPDTPPTPTESVGRGLAPAVIPTESTGDGVGADGGSARNPHAATIDGRLIAAPTTTAPPHPNQILAITFTNKAAGELKDRLCALLGTAGSQIWASTFHAMCARILRRDAALLGYTSNFTIYDTDDSKRILKACLKELELDEKRYPLREMLSQISKYKDQLQYPDDVLRQTESGRVHTVAQIYQAYQTKLLCADAMDFDDLILNTIVLLQDNPDVRAHYQHKFRYILVDEYQDTNQSQFALVKLLLGSHQNLCVVGDDDQSIYKFRGATIENILNFEKHFPGAAVIRLEQNYRSTNVILNAANAVIAHNQNRKGKNLWTNAKGGDKILSHRCEDEQAEARFIADKILTNVKNGAGFKDHAVLYRLNAQSAPIESTLVRCGIPYRVIGGHRFYDRKEIKDMVAYLCVIQNPADTVRLRRILNEPKRGLGDTSVEKAVAIAAQHNQTLFEVLQTADQYPVLSRSAPRMQAFCSMINNLITLSDQIPPSGLLEAVLHQTGYLDMLNGNPEENQTRIENLQELKSNLIRYESTIPTESPGDAPPSLRGATRRGNPDHMATGESVGRVLPDAPPTPIESVGRGLAPAAIPAEPIGDGVGADGGSARNPHAATIDGRLIAAPTPTVPLRRGDYQSPVQSLHNAPAAIPNEPTGDLPTANGVSMAGLQLRCFCRAAEAACENISCCPCVSSLHPALRAVGIAALRGGLPAAAIQTTEPPHPPETQSLLQGFLQDVALLSDADNYDADADAVVLMTMHAAKGLEFDHVFLPGLEQGIFPGWRSYGEPDGIEEERRLCYVALTRAKKALYLSTANRRLLFGKTDRNPESPFLTEIPPELLDFVGAGFHAHPQSPHKTTRNGVGTPPGRSPQSFHSISGDAPPSLRGATRRGNPDHPNTGAGVGAATSRPQSPPTGGNLPQSPPHPGDKVTHNVFGAGTVQSVTPMGGDYLLEIRFQSGDHKKIMHNYAKLTRE